MSKQNINYRKYFPVSEFLLLEIGISIVFAAYLMLGTISNYGAASFLIKIIMSLIILSLLLLNSKRRNENPVKIISDLNFSKIKIIVSVLILFPAITLIYSANSQFGLLKVINFLLSSIFPAFVLYYLLHSWNDLRTKVLSVTIISGAVISVIIILIENPFYYDQIYDLITFHWSHVFFGRYLGLVFLISLILLIEQNKGKAQVIFFIITLFIAFGLIMTGLRSAISGVVVSSIVLMAAGYLSKKISTKQALLIVMVLASGVVTYFAASSWQGNIKTRINSLVETFQLQSSEDEAIQSRIESYDLAFNLIAESPISGVGFGGYKRIYDGNKIGEINFYPHNIFLEAFVELGIIGLIVFTLMIFLILKASYKVSYKLLALIIFSLWLAQFSKDIPSQTTLWVGLAFLIGKK